jgi:competence protein ComGC
MRRSKKRGQSTIEYLIILSVIIAAIILIAQNMLKPQLQQITNRAVQRMTDTRVITPNMLP